MTVGKLIELLNRAIEEGCLHTDGVILAATLNGARQDCVASMTETVNKTNSDGFYLMASIPEDPDNDMVFYTVNKEEETNE